MKNTSWIVYIGTAVGGLAIGLAVVANLSFQASSNKSAPVATIGEAMSAMISKEVTKQISTELQGNNPCLISVVAAPKSKGIQYNYYDVQLPQEAYPSETIRVVDVKANDYQLTLKYSNDNSCANRPNSNKLTVAKNFSFGQTFFFNPDTNVQILNDSGENSAGIESAAMDKVATAKLGGQETFKRVSTGNNAKFDTAKCCELVAKVPGDGPDPSGGTDDQY